MRESSLQIAFVSMVTGLCVLIALALEAALVAAVARRVLGVPVGWPRSVAVGLMALVGLGVMESFVLNTAGLSGSSAFTVAPAKVILFVPVAAAWVFVLGVAALVILEGVVPTGSLPSSSRFLTGWGARRRRTKRYGRIVAIAIKHGLGGYLRGTARVDSSSGVSKTARSLRDALDEAGVTFIKLGQMVSTRQDRRGDEGAEMGRSARRTSFCLCPRYCGSASSASFSP